MMPLLFTVCACVLVAYFLSNAVHLQLSTLLNFLYTSKWTTAENLKEWYAEAGIFNIIGHVNLEQICSVF